MRMQRAVILFFMCLFTVIFNASTATAAARSTYVIIKNNTNHTMNFVSGARPQIDVAFDDFRWVGHNFAN